MTYELTEKRNNIWSLLFEDSYGISEDSEKIKKDKEDSLHHFLSTYSTENITEIKFAKLKAEWEKDIQFLSNTNEIVMHPSYQQIIGMGQEIIPLILTEMKSKLGLWFWALKSITGEDPVPTEEIGKITEMTKRWIDWGYINGFLSDQQY